MSIHAAKNNCRHQYAAAAAGLCYDLCSVNGCVDTNWVWWLTVEINGIFLMNVRVHQIPKVCCIC